MELFQVFWDDQKKLFLEFEKNDEEQVLFLPEKINRLNIQFEISKIVKQEICYKESPSLVSIKKIYHSNEFLGFSIELDEIQGYVDIQIKILRLTIYLYSGQRIEYTFSEKYNVSDIWVNDDCYAGFQFIDLSTNKNQIQLIYLTAVDLILYVLVINPLWLIKHHFCTGKAGGLGNGSIAQGNSR